MEDEKGNESWWLISLSTRLVWLVMWLHQLLYLNKLFLSMLKFLGEFVLIARNPKYSVQKGSKVRTSQIFSCWFCKQGDGKRGPWKSNSCLQKEGFCLRLGWIVQNQTSPVPQTFVSSGDGQVLFTLDLFFCCCAVAGRKVTAKHLFDTCVSSVWRWTWGSLILCLITKCPGQAFTFCGSQAAAVLCRHREQRPPSRCGWCPAGWTQKPNP